MLDEYSNNLKTEVMITAPSGMSDHKYIPKSDGRMLNNQKLISPSRTLI